MRKGNVDGKNDKLKILQVIDHDHIGTCHLFSPNDQKIRIRRGNRERLREKEKNEKNERKSTPLQIGVGGVCSQKELYSLPKPIFIFLSQIMWSSIHSSQLPPSPELHAYATTGIASNSGNASGNCTDCNPESTTLASPEITSDDAIIKVA